MSVADILDGAFKLFRANARALVVTVAAVVVPLQLLSSVAQRSVFGGQGITDVLRDPASVGTGQTGSGYGTIVVLVAFLLSLLVTPFIAGAVSRIVAASYLGEELSARPALAAAARRFPALLGATVLVHLLELPGLVLCILPGLAVMAMFVLTAPAIAIEEIGPMQGMRRSWRLVKGRFWPTLGIALLAGLIASLTGQFLAVIPTVLALVVGLRWGFVLLAAGGTLAAVITEPIVTIVATLLYFDARILKEGFDLHVIAAELGQPSTPREAPGS
jgi:hypothetical protein